MYIYVCVYRYISQKYVFYGNYLSFQINSLAFYEFISVSGTPPPINLKSEWRRIPKFNMVLRVQTSTN